MTDQTTLASFLRTRRGLVKPCDVGLRQDGPRRVSGLRRAEVASLAGISVEYYLRLETGRDTQPSGQVLGGLARALHLGGDATEYMHSLVRCTALRRPHTQLDPAIQALIDGWSAPAYVQSPNMTVLAANAAAKSLNSFFAPGVNLLRKTFLDPEAREVLRNWDSISAMLVRWLRFTTIAIDPNNGELPQLIDEVSANKRFRALWAQHEPERKTTGNAFFVHPEVGSIDLVYRALVIPESQHTIVLYRATPDCESEEKLAAIAS